MALEVYPHAKFKISSFNCFRDMERVPTFQKVGHVTPSEPRGCNFPFSSVVPFVVYLRAKFKISSFNRSRDMEGVPKFQN